MCCVGVGLTTLTVNLDVNYYTRNNKQNNLWYTEVCCSLRPESSCTTIHLEDSFRLLPCKVGPVLGTFTGERRTGDLACCIPLHTPLAVLVLLVDRRYSGYIICSGGGIAAYSSSAQAASNTIM